MALSAGRELYCGSTMTKSLAVATAGCREAAAAVGAGAAAATGSCALRLAAAMREAEAFRASGALAGSSFRTTLLPSGMSS